MSILCLCVSLFPLSLLVCLQMLLGLDTTDPAFELPASWLWDMIDEFIYQVRKGGLLASLSACAAAALWFRLQPGPAQELIPCMLFCL